MSNTENQNEAIQPDALDDDTVILEDEDGNVISFEFLELVTVDDVPYAILMPTDDPEGDLGVVIVEVVDLGTDSEHYDAVTDDALNERIFEQFRKEFGDKYDFAD